MMTKEQLEEYSLYFDEKIINAVQDAPSKFSIFAVQRERIPKRMVVIWKEVGSKTIPLTQSTGMIAVSRLCKRQRRSMVTSSA